MKQVSERRSFSMSFEDVFYGFMVLLFVALVVFLGLCTIDEIVLDERDVYIVDGEIIKLDSYSELTSRSTSTVVHVAYVAGVDGKYYEANMTGVQWALSKTGDKVKVKKSNIVGVVFGFHNETKLKLMTGWSMP